MKISWKLNTILFTILEGFVFGFGPDDNLLCHDADWNELHGDWTYDSVSCSLTQTDASTWGRVIWFGSADGNTYDSNYAFNSYNLTLHFMLTSATYGAGLIVRSENVSLTANQGRFYTYAMYDYSGSNGFLLGYYSEPSGSWNGLSTVYDTVNLNQNYTIGVVVDGTSGDFYWDGTKIMSGITLDEFTTGLSLCVHAPYSLFVAFAVFDN